MCGRFTITVTFDQLQTYVQQRYQIDAIQQELILPRYNVAPGTDIISVIYDGKQHRIGLLKWGFIPEFSKDQKVKIINAKAETLFEKPVFKQAALTRRCVILADGFYEWQAGKEKQPMRIMTDGGLFAIAGIWNTYIDQQGNKQHTVALITTTAREELQAIHDRMPVILTKESEAQWLNVQLQDAKRLQTLLQPYPYPMSAYPVSKKINKADYQDADAIVPIALD